MVNKKRVFEVMRLMVKFLGATRDVCVVSAAKPAAKQGCTARATQLGSSAQRHKLDHLNAGEYWPECCIVCSRSEPVLQQPAQIIVTDLTLLASPAPSSQPRTLPAHPPPSPKSPMQCPSPSLSHRAAFTYGELIPVSRRPRIATHSSEVDDGEQWYIDFVARTAILVDPAHSTACSVTRSVGLFGSAFDESTLQPIFSNLRSALHRLARRRGSVRALHSLFRVRACPSITCQDRRSQPRHLHPCRCSPSSVVPDMG